MTRFWTFLLIFCVLIYTFSYRSARLLLCLLQLGLRTVHSGLDQESVFICRLLAFVAVELVAQGCCQFCHYFWEWSEPVDTEVEEDIKVTQSEMTQTTGQWIKKMRKHDRNYTEVTLTIKVESRHARQRRVKLVKKFKMKTSKIKNDTDSKSKLMDSVNKKVVSLALEVDGLINRIQEKRLILDRQRTDNKHVLQRYEQLYQEIQQRYMYE